MDFGSLQTVTAWRLTRAAVMCQVIVVLGPEGFRVVVIEDQQIVEWTRCQNVFALREHVRAAFRTRLRAGWAVRTSRIEADPLAEEDHVHAAGTVARQPAGLVRIAGREWTSNPLNEKPSESPGR